MTGYTVKELIGTLKTYPDDWIVCIGYDRGDFYDSVQQKKWQRFSVEGLKNQMFLEVIN